MQDIILAEINAAQVKGLGKIELGLRIESSELLRNRLLFEGVDRNGKVTLLNLILFQEMGEEFNGKQVVQPLLFDGASSYKAIRVRVENAYGNQVRLKGEVLLFESI